jgi:hypothetical protein
MPGTTLHNTLHTGITLGSGHAGTPYTIASNGAIEPANNAAYGIYANTSFPTASVVNFGIVTAGTSGTAIKFADTGYLLNAGTIEGAASYPGTGVYLADGGTVTNAKAGLITAYRIAVHGVDVAATVDNAGTIAGQEIGVRLSGGGLVNNEAGGTITGKYAVQGHLTASDVVNSGTIIGQYAGVGLYGGQITNQAGGTISELLSSGPGVIGKVAAYINDGTGTITNDGMISGYYGAALLTGGLITNAAGATITGGGNGMAKAAYITGGVGTVINDGVLQAAYAAVLEDGGSIVNDAGGTMTGNVQVFGGAGYITNAGMLSGALLLGDNGAVENLQGGTISGAAVLEGGTLNNYGLISASVNAVTGEDAVIVVNQQGGTITGGSVGVVLAFGGGGILNAGVISGAQGVVGRYQGGAKNQPPPLTYLSNDGVILSAVGSFAVAVDAGQKGDAYLRNDAYINHAISLSTGDGLGTVVNAGSIGTLGGGLPLAGDAVVDNARGTLILDAGQSLGDGIATFGAGSELDLAAGQPGFGSLANPGSYFGFTTLDVESGASWRIGNAAGAVSISGITNIQDFGTLDIAGSLAGIAVKMEGGGATAILSAAPSAVYNMYPNGQSQADEVSVAAVQITNFGVGDTIELGVSLIPALPAGDHFSAVYAGGTLRVSEVDAGGIIRYSAIVSLSGVGLTSGNFSVSSGADDVVVTEIPCFAAGTRILTPAGDVNVEDIRAGDTVVTVRENGPVTGRVIWTGRRSLDVSRHPNPEALCPIRIIAGAFAPGLPERDLRLSPHHALYVDGTLVEAASLVNGATVIQELDTRFVTYHHIALETHDVILAEGLPAETYLETGHRNMFEGESVMVLHPDFRVSADAGFCAPMIREGAPLEAVRARLLARAHDLGFCRTDAIDLTARINGQRLQAA